MAIQKQIMIRRREGSYFKPVGFTFDRGGMITFYGDLWKDVEDRDINPAQPLESHIAVFSNDEKLNTKLLSMLYELAEEFPELAGGQPVIEAETVTLDQTDINLSVGKKQKLIATILPEVAKKKDVIWKSSDDKIATVTDGKVEAIAVGTATITCTTVQRARVAECKVTVE